jgi:hypothetical protein
MKKFSLMIVLALALSCSKSTQSTMPLARGPVLDDSTAAPFAGLSRERNNTGSGEQTPTDPIVTAAPSEGKKQERMVVHNASITIAVKEVQSAIQKTEEIAKKYEGFVVSSSKSGEATYFNPDGGDLTIRVPDPKLNDVLNEISALGKVRSRSVTGQDVTAQFTDLQLRLDNKDKMLLRLRELLAQAESTSVALEVEKEISRITLEIEQIKGTLIYLKDQITYSTITVSVHKRHRPGPLGAVFYGVVWVVGKLFVLN